MSKYYVHKNRNLECSKCHVKSQKWGKCWEKGLCAKCFNMCVLSCRKCGAVSNNVTAICWTTEGICGICYRTEHAPKKAEPQYKLCPKCYERLHALFYTSNNVYVNTRNYICNHCSEIFILSDKYKVNHG